MVVGCAEIRNHVLPRSPDDDYHCRHSSRKTSGKGICGENHLERDLATLEEFRAASLLYVQAAEGALAQVSRGRGHSDNEIVRRWREDAHDRVLLSLETVEDRFSRHSEVTVALGEIEDTMDQLYREFHVLRDSVHEPMAYRWSDTFVRLKELRRTIAFFLEGKISGPGD